MKSIRRMLAPLSALSLALAMAGAAAQADKPAAGAKPAAHPAELLGGLKRWHLTLPTSQEQKAFPADQIDQPELATLSRASTSS